MQLKTRIIAAFTLAVFLLISVFSAGCAASRPAEPTTTPQATAQPETTVEPTSTVEPTTTPSPAPLPTPCPTHLPELTLEEERELLGVQNINKTASLYGIIPLLFSFINERGESVQRIAWVFFGTDGEGDGVFDFWSQTKMYSVPNSNTLTMEELWQQRQPVNKRFETAEFITFFGISELEKIYHKYGIAWDFPEEYQVLASKGESFIEGYSATMTELMDLYIQCTPKELRTSLIDFDEFYSTAQ